MVRWVHNVSPEDMISAIKLWKKALTRKYLKAKNAWNSFIKPGLIDKCRESRRYSEFYDEYQNVL